jgi:tRNA/tmRNA/rRNA uracil-C5-methylase (TrmA/RlmC/RlmD family)
MNIQNLTIHGFAFGGEALGRLENGKICFVRGGIPGEEVSVEILSEKKNFARGRIVEILRSSSLRQEKWPTCPANCPGCSCNHIPYETELEWKEKIFRSFAEKARLKHSDPEKFLLPIRGADPIESYRNKIRLSLEFTGTDPRSVRAGYRGEDNVSLLEITDCPLAQPPIREQIRNGAWKEQLTGTEKSVTFRCTAKDGVSFFFDRGNPEKILTETLTGAGEFQVAEHAFLQVNSFMSGILAQKCAQIVEELPADFLLELYCGCGCFSIVSAKKKNSLHCLGIELEKSSVQLAKKNALVHGVGDRCTFLAGDSAKVFRKKFPRGLGKNSILLLDPPRTGMDKAAVKLVAESKAEFLIYISCSPDTLFRDLAFLEEQGPYRIRESQAVDLFPRTGHFESITFCERM